MNGRQTGGLLGDHKPEGRSSFIQHRESEAHPEKALHSARSPSIPFLFKVPGLGSPTQNSGTSGNAILKSDPTLPHFPGQIRRSASVKFDTTESKSELVAVQYCVLVNIRRHSTCPPLMLSGGLRQNSLLNVLFYLFHSASSTFLRVNILDMPVALG
jgi:hypothetical protein